MLEIRVTVRGVTPLLMNRMTADQLEGLRTKKSKPKTAPRPATPRDEAAPKVYAREDTGTPYIPAQNLLSCLIVAGQGVRLDGKRQVSTATSTQLPSFLWVSEAYLDLVDKAGKPPKWEVDVRQGRNPNGGEAVCVVRPRFDDWGFAFTLQMDDAIVGETLVRELIDRAGNAIGLGDFRPNRKGIFGRFRVDRWEVSRPGSEPVAAE